ncbi:nucleoside deaminase [Stygiobacter electus]|uniref:tRNA-specific adenosine deaminase n=1 Tax=Stygiobacter electus TaxID=3032292 RepID=A0AAE3TEK6_9BACT|nr:nucleoside deaminase [Stygiobacter electus]MDF1612378.1 nucleoside deaminase [Stygiobacter electus]
MLFDESIYRFMYAALQEAETAFEKNEVPIGALVVFQNKIIGRGYNQTELLKDPTAHAEMIAITSASNYLGSKFLDECDIFITVEPCIMCSGAILLSRIKNVYFGSFEPKFGAAGSLFNILDSNKYNHKPNVHSGIYEKESRELLEKYFKSKRLSDK